MDWQVQKEYLDQLFCNVNDNFSEITRIYHKINKNTNYSALDEVIKFLNKNAVHLLSTEMVDLLKKNRLDAYSYLLVANDLLDIEDIKDDLINGEVLAQAVPTNTIRKLKSRLGLATAHAMQDLSQRVESVQSTTSVQETTGKTRHHEEDSAMASSSTAVIGQPSIQHKQPTEQNQSTTLLQVAQPRHKIHHAGTSDNDNRLAIKIKNQCKFMERLNGNMLSHLLDLKETTTFADSSSMIKRFSFGEPNQLMDKTCKTILLMGETGSGKTTMINAMINYVLGVKWDDNFRFKLIKEEVSGGSQAHSQTQGITAYDLHHQHGFRIPFSLTIVDTPGFGDTRGMERDKEITAIIKKFFEHVNGIQELDAVGFVVKSSDARLTPSQKYIFNSVLSIFGKYMGGNIRFLVTYADGGDSQVFAAIKEAGLPCQMDSNGSPCHHNFNNDALYKQQLSNDVISSYKWKMSMENFESFFRELKGMRTTSLQMTKEVLEMRKHLEVQLKFMWDGIDQQLAKIEELRKTNEIIAQNKEKIDNNQNFEITVKVPRCHYPCNPSMWTNFCPAFWEFSKISSVPLSVAKTIGSFMVDPVTVVIEAGINLFSASRTCKVCPGKCPSGDHVNENRLWVYKEVEEKHTLFDVRKQYEDAKGEQVTAEEILTRQEEEMEKLKSNILYAMDEITVCTNMLKRKALGDIPLTMVEYIQLKIKNEEKEMKRGYEQRIEILKDVLKTANENLNKATTKSD